MTIRLPATEKSPAPRSVTSVAQRLSRSTDDPPIRRGNMGGSPALAARDSGLAGNERDDGAHDYDFYRAIQGYLDAAARLARIEQSVQAILCQPTNEFP